MGYFANGKAIGLRGVVKILNQQRTTRNNHKIIQSHDKISNKAPSNQFINIKTNNKK